MNIGSKVKVKIKRPHQETLIGEGKVVNVSKVFGKRQYIIKNILIPEMVVREETIIK